MTITLQTLASGDTQYISKHNSNYSAIAAAINSLLSSVSASFGASLSLTATYQALFGVTAILIGSESYTYEQDGTELTISGGYEWRPSLGMVVGTQTDSIIDFAGVATGTYYLTPDSSGSVSRTADPNEAIYEVVWDGTDFDSITLELDVLSIDNRPRVLDLTYAASMTAEFGRADVIRVTLTGDASITLNGAADGQKCILEVTQDATGGRELTFGSEVRFGTDLTSIVLTTTASKSDKIGFIYNADAAKYDVVAMMKGF